MGILSKKWNFIDGKMSGLRVCPANQINNIDFPRGMRDKVEIRNPVEGTKTSTLYLFIIEITVEIRNPVEGTKTALLSSFQMFLRVEIRNPVEGTKTW